MKIKQAYRETLSLLGEVYERNESVSITRLLFDDLELDHLKLASDPDLQISIEKYECLKKYRKQLLKKVPIQYVLGYSWFYERKFRVAPGCLIPRPETEELVYNIIDENIEFKRVLDIGTGSGCIAVSIKAEFPGAGVWAMEKFPGTLEIAQHNARIHNA
ncbi:MAG: N5-glutamine methyltransferase family protein, partial [bacterium]